MLRINTPPSWVTTTHTGKTSACGTDSPLMPTVPGGTQDSKLPHRDQHVHFPTPSSDLLVRPSHTQQQWAPQLDPTTPFRSQTSPDPSPRRAEPLSLSPDLSPQERGDPESRCSVRDPDWNHLGHVKILLRLDSTLTLWKGICGQRVQNTYMQNASLI